MRHLRTRRYYFAVQSTYKPDSVSSERALEREINDLTIGDTYIVSEERQHGDSVEIRAWPNLDELMDITGSVRKVLATRRPG